MLLFLPFLLFRLLLNSFFPSSFALILDPFSFLFEKDDGGEDGGEHHDDGQDEVERAGEGVGGVRIRSAHSVPYFAAGFLTGSGTVY